MVGLLLTIDELFTYFYKVPSATLLCLSSNIENSIGSINIAIFKQ